MNEDRLRTLLQEAPLPGASEAERRGLLVVEQAYAERRPATGRPLPRLALALAVAALLGALLLSPAGAAVRHWIGDVFDAGVPNAAPSLTHLPGGGHLLVESRQGPWVVQADGSRRLLGHYDGASWSPHGLFVAAVSGRSLSAVEPDGTPHWSVSAKRRIEDPRWSPSGFRVAYRSGRELRVIDADGSGDRLIDGATAGVPPAWLPTGLPLLAYVTGSGLLRIVNVDSGETAASVSAAPGVAGLSWSADGSALLQASPRGIWLRPARTSKLDARLRLGAAHAIRLPRGASVRAAAFSPRRPSIAVLLAVPGQAGIRSELVLANPGTGGLRRLFVVSGRLSGLAWSPDGRRLLLGWPTADQWLFIPVDGGRLRAVDGIAGAFAPGRSPRAPFPRIAGWCCAAAPSGG